MIEYCICMWTNGQTTWIKLQFWKYPCGVDSTLDKTFLHVGAQEKGIHQSGFDELLMVSRCYTVWTFDRQSPQSGLHTHGHITTSLIQCVVPLLHKTQYFVWLKITLKIITYCICCIYEIQNLVIVIQAIWLKPLLWHLHNHIEIYTVFEVFFFVLLPDWPQAQSRCCSFRLVTGTTQWDEEQLKNNSHNIRHEASFCSCNLFKSEKHKQCYVPTLSHL